MNKNELFVYNKNIEQSGKSVDAAKLHDLMFEAFKSKDRNKIAKVRKEYEDCYGDQLEGVEALFDFQRFFNESQEADAIRQEKKNENWRKLPYRVQNNKQERYKNLIKSLTEYQFLITHFIIENNDRDFLKNFWQALETEVVDGQNKEKFGQIKRGVISQVATYRIFKELGNNPALSHPEDDAFHSIDLWRENNPVQIKTSFKDPQLIATDSLSFPSIRVRDAKNRERHFSNDKFAKMQQFQMNIEDYRKTHKNTKDAYYMEIPISKVDSETGEPQPELLQFYQKRLAELDTVDRRKAA